MAVKDDRIVRQALKAALDSKSIPMVFQPIWTKEGDCWGFEALARFKNGSPPDAVWNLAKRERRHARLDWVALKAAIASARGVFDRCFLNISSHVLQSPDQLARIGKPEEVVWEVTETLELNARLLDGVRTLKRWGYHIAMDDAGVGPSTVERFEQLEPTIVKIDRKLVQVWASGQVDLLRYWVRLAKDHGARVVVEGVEDFLWVDPLIDEGIDAFQGYALGRPAVAEEWGSKVDYQLWTMS